MFAQGSPIPGRRRDQAWGADEAVSPSVATTASSSASSSPDATVAVSSGLIAGESLMGVAVKLWLAAPGLVAEIAKKFGS